MDKSYRQIKIFVSHAFAPQAAFDIEKFRTNIELLVKSAEAIVRKEYQDFELDTTYLFNDAFSGLPDQIESEIRSSHLGIVDITENKANVFYEYGLMYGLNIPVLLIKESSTMGSFPIPGDIANRLVQVYDSFAQMIEKSKHELAKRIMELINSDSLYSVHLNKIWFQVGTSKVQVITSTECEKREQFASPESDNYMLLESLGDKDSLLEVMCFLHRTYRRLDAQMFDATGFSGSMEDNLVVIGGPGAEDDEEGDCNTVCKFMMSKMKVSVSYSEDCEKLLHDGREYTATKQGNKTTQDYGYFARFPNPLNPRTSVILINGIHTYGVLGAAKAFSDHPAAQENIKKVLTRLGIDEIRQASFECFFKVDVIKQSVICPVIDERNIIKLEKK
ncbi:hypothetical protein [Sediminibacterium sp.]|uniref:hypothetical protein n=1 Tax=Sediminibacterium sp. TaxID=1917865 RepID=UPI0025F3CE10|nr:hypothetical protein [Sediminibacterium sp.]